MIFKHHMEPYHIKYQYQETAIHLNTALLIATCCTRDTSTQHLHDKTKVLPIDIYLKLHATQLQQLTQRQTHPLHDLNAYSDPPRNMKATIFHSNELTSIIISEPDIKPQECRENLKHIHTTITSQYLNSRKTTNLLTPHPMTFIYRNKHYHVICVQNWHSSKPTNHHSCKVADIQ